MWPINFVASVLTGFFGWTGGRGDDYWYTHKNWPRWLLQSWTRDWLIGPVCCIVLWLYGVHSWVLIPFIGLTGAALSTYWDFLYKDKDNFWIHGFVIGLAALPIIFITGHWWWFLIRSLIMAIWMGGWSLLIDDAGIEEFGRYSIIGATVWLIC